MQEWEKLSYYWDDDGSLVVRGRLAPEDGRSSSRRSRSARERLWNEQPRRSQDARFRGTAAAAAPPEQRRRAGRGRRGRARPRGRRRTEVATSIRWCSTSSRRPSQEGGDGSCLLADGPAVAPETARRLACDASIVTLLERAGEPLGVGRKTRKIPLALRRALEARDGCCRFPGCTSRRVQAHHIQHWADGGETELDKPRAALPPPPPPRPRRRLDGRPPSSASDNRFGHPRSRRPTPATRQRRARCTTPTGSSASPPRPTRPATATRWTSTSPSATSSRSSDDPGSGSRRRTRDRRRAHRDAARPAARPLHDRGRPLVRIGLQRPQTRRRPGRDQRHDQPRAPGRRAVARRAPPRGPGGLRGPGLAVRPAPSRSSSTVDERLQPRRAEGGAAARRAPSPTRAAPEATAA